MRFWREKKGASVVLGTLLMFTIMVGLYVSTQSTQVPIWNSQIDLQALEKAYGDFLFLKSDITNVATLKRPKSAIITMGARYPNRMIFINPKQGVSGLLEAEDSTVTVTYTIEFGGVLEPVTISTNISSSRLIYTLMGSERIKLIYEYGLVIREFPAGSVSTDPQPLIVGDDLYVPVLEASMFAPIASMRTESFSIKPYSAVDMKRSITRVTITLPTNYPHVWKDRLEGVSTVETIEELDTTAGTFVEVDEDAGQIIIDSSAVRRITFPQNPATDAQFSAGVIFFDHKTAAGVDPSSAFPNIYGISIAAVGTGDYKATHSTITATVMNVSAPFDIHADLTDIMSITTAFDVLPDTVTTLGYAMSDSSWQVPNGPIEVQWTEFEHPDYQTQSVFVIVFTVYNSVLDQQYMGMKIARRGNAKDWQ